jgi:hypothetical protein
MDKTMPPLGFFAMLVAYIQQKSIGALDAAQS